jgi:hypothetical protein
MPSLLMSECVHAIGAGCARFAPGARSCVRATVVSAGDERSAVRCVVILMSLK